MTARLATDTMDQRIAEGLLGEAYNPFWHQFTSDPEHAERLYEWLGEHDITAILEGGSVTLKHRRTRLFTVAGATPLLALAKAAIKLLDERPDLVR